MHTNIITHPFLTPGTMESQGLAEILATIHTAIISTVDMVPIMDLTMTFSMDLTMIDLDIIMDLAIIDMDLIGTEDTVDIPTDLVITTGNGVLPLF